MILSFKRIMLAVFTAVFGVFVLVLSDDIRQGVINGILLCTTSVIPSLFLFTAVSIFAVKSGILLCFRKLTPLTNAVFRLNGHEFSVFFLSLVAGYPVGAKMVEELYNDGKISFKKAKRMLTFCVGAGPAFAVTTVGELVLGSKGDGIRILMATFSSSLLLAVVSRFVEKTDDKEFCAEQKAPEIAISDAFVLSVSGAAETMLKVSTFVVVFSGILGGLSVLNSPGFVKKYIFSLLEVTTGVSNFGRGELYAVAFLVGFGGVSVHLQIMSAAGKIRPKYRRVLMSRLAHGVLSAMLILIFDLVWPRTVETAVMGQTVEAGVHGNPMSAVAMLALAVTVVIYTSKVKNSVFRYK